GEDAAARPERKLLSIVIFMDLSDDLVIAEVGYGVQVRDESEHRTVFISRCGRDVGVEIALCVHLHVCDPHGKKLPVEMPGELELAGGRGHRGARFVAGCPYGNIFQQSFKWFHSGSYSLSSGLSFCP